MTLSLHLFHSIFYNSKLRRSRQTQNSTLKTQHFLSPLNFSTPKLLNAAKRHTQTHNTSNPLPSSLNSVIIIIKNRKHFKFKVAEISMITVNPQYVVDEGKQPKAVLLTMKEWNDILEALEELDDIRAYDAIKSGPQEAVPLDNRSPPQPG
jgi:hypothetical protein